MMSRAPARRRALRRLLVTTLGLFAGWLRVAQAQAPTPAPAPPQAPLSEAAVKAGFLLNFTTFVEWPPTALDGYERFIVAIYGDDSVALEMERLAAGRQVRGLPLVVRSLREPGPAERVHLAYVGRIHEAQLREMAARLPGPVLLVTHAQAGLDAGAVLNFVRENGRVRFQASTRAAEQRGLRLSSRLLTVAITVEGR